MAHDEGFTLIELLVVMVIMGILAAIAIPSFLDERDGAYRAAVNSDLRNVAIQAESYFADVGTYDGFEADAQFTDFSESGGVSLAIDPATTTGTDFCIIAIHARLPAGETWSFRSSRSIQLRDTPC